MIHPMLSFNPPPDLTRTIGVLLPALLIAGAVARAADAPATRPASDRPNIIMIFTDDQAPFTHGFEGNALMKTPHLDQLAGESLQFTRCYVPTPQCAPSRATILTGQYPHSHGVTTNGPELPAGAITFSAELSKSGYACGIVGKWHLPYESAGKPGFGFTDYVATDDGRNWKWKDCPVWLNGEKQTADQYLTDWHGDRAVEFLDRFAGRQPFFLWLCFRAPHAPLNYPPGTENLYPPADLPLPELVLNEPSTWPPDLTGSDPATGYRKHTPESLRKARSEYFAMISRIDDNVGKLMAKLDAMKLRENTVVVFTSDNGWMLGEHHLFAKGPFFYEELVRMPLLVRYPKFGHAGEKTDRLVSHVDFAPTFCELAGISPPITMQGHSIVPLLKDPERGAHPSECFLEYDEQNGRKFPARGIVSPRYKLIDYRLPGQDRDLFYDLAHDPKETYNGINDLRYRTVVKVMRERLAAWQKETRDPLQ